MVRTARAERCVARRTGVLAGEVLVDRQLEPTNPAADGALVASVDGPAFGLVIRTRRVAVETGVVLPAARKPDRDHVPRAAVVGTPRLVVQLDAPNRRIRLHGRVNRARVINVSAPVAGRFHLSKAYDGIRWMSGATLNRLTGVTVGMTDRNTPFDAAFEMQRMTIEQSQRAFEQGIEFQQNANRMLLGGLETQEAAQRQSLELMREVTHGYFDALESTMPGAGGSFRQLHRTIDQQFDAIEEGHAQLLESLEAQMEEGADVYDEALEQYIETLEEQTDAMLDAQEQTHEQTAEVTEEFQGQFEEAQRQMQHQSEQFQDQLEEQSEQFQSQFEEFQGQLTEQLETFQNELLEAQGEMQTGAQQGVEASQARSEEVAERFQDQLEEIEGLGETYANRLREAGFDSMEALAEANAEAVADAAEVSREQAEEWIEAVRPE